MSKLSMVGELWQFFGQNKKWWMMPILLILLAMGALMVFASSSALAPFIYSIF